ncbi:MAG: PH domain-containing protein [Oscillospiraceae bacterium]|nr:PH domain-containing protein [Oscillospiraceae bacterium]MBR7085020.1 PH domain-containing protein [Oscillospiraceae bacterium]
MKEYSADMSAMKLLQIIACLLAALLIGLSARFLYRWVILMWSFIILFAVTAVLLSFFCMPLYFSNLKCIVTANQVTIRTGMFFRQEQSIRLQSVQFVQTITGPWDGILGLNFVILYVYGGSLMIFFLKKADRLEFTEFLERKGVFHAP